MPRRRLFNGSWTGIWTEGFPGIRHANDALGNCPYLDNWGNHCACKVINGLNQLHKKNHVPCGRCAQIEQAKIRNTHLVNLRSEIK